MILQRCCHDACEDEVQRGCRINGSSVDAVGLLSMPGSDDGGGGTVVVTRVWTASELHLGRRIAGRFDVLCSLVYLITAIDSRFCGLCVQWRCVPPAGEQLAWNYCGVVNEGVFENQPAALKIFIPGAAKHPADAAASLKAELDAYAALEDIQGKD